MRLIIISLGLIVILGLSSTSYAGNSLNTPMPEPTYMYGGTLLAMSPDGNLYSCNGNKISRWIPAENSFQDVVTGIQTAFGGSVEPSGFAMLTNDVAVVLSGWSDVMGMVYLGTGVIDPLNNLTFWGNYGAAVDPISGRLFVTDSYGAAYLINTVGEGSSALFYSHPSAMFGSSLAFDKSGNLFLPVGTAYSDYPNSDSYPIDLIKIPAGYIADFIAGGSPNPNDIVTLVSGAMVSGSASVAVDDWGRVYVEAADAIYRIKPTTGEVTVQEGDASQNVFSSTFATSGQCHTGMVYDSARKRLLYGLGTGYPAQDPMLMESDVALYGDADLNGMVAFADYQTLERNFGTLEGATWADGDFNYDGAVTFADYQILESHFGSHTPEPATVVVMALGLGGVLASRTKRRRASASQ